MQHQRQCHGMSRLLENHGSSNCYYSHTIQPRHNMNSSIHQTFLITRWPRHKKESYLLMTIRRLIVCIALALSIGYIDANFETTSPLRNEHSQTLLSANTTNYTKKIVRVGLIAKDGKRLNAQGFLVRKQQLMNMVHNHIHNDTLFQVTVYNCDKICEFTMCIIYIYMCVCLCVCTLPSFIIY